VDKRGAAQYPTALSLPEPSPPLLIGYARAARQDVLDHQSQALKAYGCETLFTDLRIGASVVRPALEEALGRAKAGDVFVVARLEVLAHDHRDLMRTVMTLRRQQFDLVVIDQQIDTREADDTLMPALALLARFQLDVREARKTEPASQPSKGRARTISDEDWPDIQQRIEDGELTLDEAAEELGVDRATVQRRLKQDA
jgi:DNA invertase Pin-like site-specific DNA recombinase